MVAIGEGGGTMLTPGSGTWGGVKGQYLRLNPVAMELMLLGCPFSGAITWVVPLDVPLAGHPVAAISPVLHLSLVRYPCHFEGSLPTGVKFVGP